MTKGLILRSARLLVCSSLPSSRYLRRASPEKHTGEYSPHISENKAECLANSTRQTVRVDADIVLLPGGEVMLTSAHGVAGAVKVRELLPDGTLRRKPHEKKNKV
mgnify:CR=1 FL=1